ncbi:MAG: ATP-dependent DNA ligase [Bacteroidetes bacterium]|nr:ATP-dependent DNA ligase [Bacteroidota bacterium]
MNTVRLENTQAGHNKFYEFQGIQTNGRFTIKAVYGRIGQAGQVSVIYDGVSKTEAEKEYEKKKSEKLKKGYLVVSRNGNSVQQVTEEKKNNDVPIIFPMNALGVKNEEHLKQLLNDDNFVAQEKLDGMRAVVHITKTGLRIFSRSAGVNDPSRPLEKTSALPHLAALKFPGMEGTVLDCEILAAGLDSAQLSGTIHKNDVSANNRLVKLYVFDILRYKGNDLTQKTLHERLGSLLAAKMKIFSKHIVYLPYAFSTDEKHKLYKSVIKNGREGIMLKNLKAVYILGGRPSNNWYKAKKSMTIDAVVLGFTTGKGKFNKQVGAVRFGQYVKGRLVELGQASGMTDIERQDMSLHPQKYINKVVTIKGMERLKSGAIRHCVFVAIRSDKNPKQCIWYQGEQ